MSSLGEASRPVVTGSPRSRDLQRKERERKRNLVRHRNRGGGQRRDQPQRQTLLPGGRPIKETLRENDQNPVHKNGQPSVRKRINRYLRGNSCEREVKAGEKTMKKNSRLRGRSRHTGFQDVFLRARTKDERGVPF